MHAIGITCLATVLALGACRTVPPAAVAPEPAPIRDGSVGVEIVPPPAGANRMELPQTQRFVFPNLVEPVAMPAYPQALLAARLAPVDVCVDVVIAADGLVMQASARADCSKGPVRDEFLRAAAAAARTWRFEPALVCIAPDTRLEDPCMHPQMVEKPTPVRLSYVFRFSQREGKPHVERVGG